MIETPFGQKSTSVRERRKLSSGEVVIGCRWAAQWISCAEELDDDVQELLQIAESLKALRPDEPAALATVVAVEGSAYRRPGARMLMTREGRSSGIVSGGCVDYDVFEHACRVMRDGKPLILRYDSSRPDDLVFGTGLGCKGVVDVLVEPVSFELSTELPAFVNRVFAERETGIELIPLPNGALTMSRFLFGAECNALPTSVCEARNSAIYEIQGTNGLQKLFVNFVEPPLHLVLFGGWFDLLPLIRFGKELGWRVSVVDVRQRENSIQTFIDADAVIPLPARQAVSRVEFDDRTAVVLMNHHFEHDSACLQALAGIPLRYLGLLGPRKRKAMLLERFAAAGLPNFAEGVLRGPVGIDIGSETPEEIALAIVAEVSSWFSRKRIVAPQSAGVP